MTTPHPTASDMEMAKEIIESWCHEDKCLELTTEHDQENSGAICMRRRIAQALAAKVQPFIDAGLALPDGTPRKVLGTLPLTADGCIAGDCAEVWITEGSGEPIASVRLDKCGYTCVVDGFWPIEECYSSSEAALDAQHKEPKSEQ